MRSNVVQIVFFLFALVLAAAVQEMSPSVGGVKAACVAAVAFRIALTRHLVPTLVGAVAAGGLCDALSSLPGFCTSGYLMAVGAFVALVRGTDRGSGRRARSCAAVRSPLFAAALFAAVAPLGEVWTHLWLWRFEASLVGGLLYSAAAGFLVELVVFALLDALERGCGIPADAEWEDAA